MIYLNLIPPEFRKDKKSFLPAGLSLPLDVVVGLGGGLLILLTLIHVLLLSVYIIKRGQQVVLKKEWENSTATKQKVDEVVMQLRSLQAMETSIGSMANNNGLVWAQKLNVLSDSLPRTIWLGKLNLSEDAFYMEGSAVDRPDTKGSDIYELISSLKKEKPFVEGFSEVKLGTIQKRTVNKVEIEDFSITAKRK